MLQNFLIVNTLFNLLQSDDIDEVFDKSVEYFKQDLTKLSDYYDDAYTDYILEIIELFEANNAFDKLFEFRNIIKNFNPEVYNRCFGYIDDGLVSYYCFTDNKQGIEESLKGFKEKPTVFFDHYNYIFEKLLLYKKTDIIKTIIEENFDEINNSDELSFNPEYKMSCCFKYIKLQEYYEENKFNRKEFINVLEPYNFNFEDALLDIFENVLINNSLDLKSLLENIKDKVYFDLLKVEIFFLKQMHSLGFPFYLSGWIFEGFEEFWLENNESNSFNKFYFETEPDKFEEFLDHRTASMVLNLDHIRYAVLWGSSYVYDFLLNHQLISEDYYSSISNKINELKARHIAFDLHLLWNYDFVHHWKRPATISNNEFKYEQKIFEKSIFIPNDEFDLQVKYIEDDLENIGELSHSIIKFGNYRYDYYRNIVNSSPFSDTFFEDNNNKKNVNIKTYDEPLKVDKKIGRNEPCPCGSGKKYKKCCL